MLFRPNIDPDCQYCEHGTALSDEEIACIKCGIAKPGSFCNKFKYDPLKRDPYHRTSIDTSSLKPDDFTL